MGGISLLFVGIFSCCCVFLFCCCFCFCLLEMFVVFVNVCVLGILSCDVVDFFLLVFVVDDECSSPVCVSVVDSVLIVDDFLLILS